MRPSDLRTYKRGFWVCARTQTSKSSLQVLLKDADFMMQPPKHHMQSVLKILLNLSMLSQHWRLGTCVFGVSQSKSPHVSSTLDLIFVQKLSLMALILIIGLLASL